MNAHDHALSLREDSDRLIDANLIAGLSIAEAKFRQFDHGFSAGLTAGIRESMKQCPELYRNFARQQIKRAEILAATQGETL